MIIIAAPPGGGKSTAFPVSESGVDWFDADRRCAALNGDSFFAIPESVRQRSALELGEFIETHIADHQSFAFETTLRTGITFEQATRARAAGFYVSMTFVGLGDPELHINRVSIRVDGGGHPAHPDQIRET